jgi:endo-alpha-1,4-polygalactosaminidase (GH114 family)
LKQRRAGKLIRCDLVQYWHPEWQALLYGSPIRRMRPLITADKPILVIEYTSNPELALSMLREIKELGFVGYVASRDLKTLSPPALGCGQLDCSQ